MEIIENKNFSSEQLDYYNYKLLILMPELKGKFVFIRSITINHITSRISINFYGRLFDYTLTLDYEDFKNYEEI